MADFTSPFWSLFIAGVSLLSIVALLWFVYAQSSGRKSPRGQSAETMGHTWDGDLAEYNNPMPKWWLNLFYITLFWGLGYLVFYPGLGAYKGLLGWTQTNQYEAEVDAAEDAYGPLFERYAGQPLEALAKDEGALVVGKRLFATYCTQCHGSDAGGARGFPSLVDASWLYGGTPEAIEKSILEGRMGLMPAWGAVIGPDAVHDVASYVESLSGRPVPPADLEAGKKAYATTCIACHGADGKGNVLLGAPDLTDDIWLYGGSRQRIVESIEVGRNGQMPAHGEFLGTAKVHLLAAYVYSFTQGNTPTGQRPVQP